MLKTVKKKILKPKRVHYGLHGVLTGGALVTLALHGHPEAEAISFCATGIAAAWADDVERALCAKLGIPATA